MDQYLGQFVYQLVEDAESGVCRAASDGPTSIAIRAFLTGLDANDKDRGKAVCMAAYDEYLALNSTLKKFGRSTVEKSIDNFIQDWTS